MPSLIGWYVRAITRVNRLMFNAVALLVAVIVPVMLYEVVSRYVFGRPTVWGMELATLLFGPYFLLGGPYLLHLGGHVNLDLLHRKLPAAWRRGLDLFNQLVIIAFCVILLYFAAPLAIQAWEFRETSYSAWNPPVWPVKFTIPLAVTLLGLQSIAEFLRILCRDPALEANAT
ncbi:TRAP transporter small permease subunit [Achromobacter sp. GG226]|uniref:TRAP transporter small permease subunit n=1 Tax=Verticiella alkaliphila TaxID=2779529 RepID=UPI001C0DBCB2|nr:TRAP transporter small permease subunit [Verticiella sp. GG226]MBU4611557.1 TRAP transporter small permease subunit [Verticiella sp. GG226]